MTLAACGRLNFDPLGSGDGGGENGLDGTTSDAEVVPPCTPTNTVISNAAYLDFALARTPTGWVLVGRTGSTFELRVIDDANVVGPPVPVTGVANVMYVQGAAWLGDSLTVAWEIPGDSMHGRFRLDGSMIDSGAFAAVDLTASKGVGVRDDMAVASGNSGASIVLSRLDATGARSTPVPVPMSAMGGAIGVGAGPGTLATAWVEFGSFPPLHLAAFDDAGSAIVADRMIGKLKGTARLMWTGSRWVLAWGDMSGPQVEVLDSSFAIVSGPSAVLSNVQAAPQFAWDGSELGTVVTNASGPEITVQMADLAGAATSMPMQFGTGATALSGPELAAGPRRFALVWYVSAPVTQTNFVVVCR